MLIYYFPEKRGATYVAPSDEDLVLMDFAVMGTESLITYLEERCGLYHKEKSFNLRLCRWFEVMKPWFEVHKDNILYQSFCLNQLSMARQMLSWRDELKMAGWDFDIKDDTTSRLGALAAIEEKFKYPGVADRLIKVSREVEKKPEGTFKDLEISLPYEKNLLKPLIHELITALERKGAKIKTNQRAENQDNNIGRISSLLSGNVKESEIELDPDDKSFQLLEFKTRKEEEEYLAILQPHGKALWIIPENKTFDNRLKGMGEAPTGSETVTQSRVTHLLHLLISLYCRPLDIRSLVEWLSSPYHPLPSNFRFALAEKIISRGGYKNEESLEIIKNYIEGKYTKTEEEETPQKAKKRIKQRQTEVENFLPFYQGKETMDDLKKSLESLSGWSTNFIHYLNDEKDKDSVMRQFAALNDGISNLLLLMHNELMEENPGNLTAEAVLKWLPEVMPEVTLQQYAAMQGSRQVVHSPGNIATPVDNIIWLGLEGMISPQAECSFLFPAERERIKGHVKFTDADKELKKREILQIMPFLMAQDHLCITFAGKRGGEDLITHPLILRLKCQVKNFDLFVKKVENLSDLMPERVLDVKNGEFKSEFNISDTSKVKFPERMSATSLQTLVYHPFDFFFDRVLGLRSAGLGNLSGIETTKGNVGHDVISKLFEKSKEISAFPEVVLDLDYDHLFNKSLQERGALLQLPENWIATKVFKLQLKDCIGNLLEIIRDNNLKVVESESSRSGYLGLIEDKTEEEIREDDLYGFIDLVLEDTEGNPVIFDFKWSDGRFLKPALEKDRSIQLAVYSYLLMGEEYLKVPTAYFFMPRGELVTRSLKLNKGMHTVVLDNSVSSGNLMEKVINSYHYRCNQIMGGKLEGYDKGPLIDLQYHTDTEEFNLLPLVSPDEEIDKKPFNNFSVYSLFKGLE